jgi:hypothetical protein
MLFLDKWTFRDTMASLTHPERRTEDEIPSLLAREKESQRLAYALAYKEMQDELDPTHCDFIDFPTQLQP